MDTHKLRPDTQAILLLCGKFGNSGSSEAPLTPGEYQRFAQWLHSNQMRPAHLLQSEGMRQVAQAAGNLDFDLERLTMLLDRGAALAFTVESWTNKGLWVFSRSDPEYPQSIKKRLGSEAPPLFYGVGNWELLANGGLAIVGSRDVDEAGIAFTRDIARMCADQRIQVISGGARGVDAEAMQAALSAGGAVTGVLADSLIRAAVASKYRPGLREERLVLISPYDPEAGFSIGNAMGRNKYIYCLSDYALVVSASSEQGGTWYGAVENLKRAWIPLFVRDGTAISIGNQQLLERGGIRIDSTLFTEQTRLANWLNQHGANQASYREVGDATMPVHQQALLNHTDNATDRQSVPHEPHAQSDVSPALPTPDLFAVVWPYLEQVLQVARTDHEVAELLHIEHGQAKSWLKRAVASGKARKLNKPVKYIALSGQLAETMPMF